MPKIQESAENYLETILVLKERNGTVRSVDIAAEMGFSKPSVSVAMKHLREACSRMRKFLENLKNEQK